MTFNRTLVLSQLSLTLLIAAFMGGPATFGASFTGFMVYGAPLESEPPDFGPRPETPPTDRDFRIWLTGDPSDARVVPQDGPALLLMGGSTEVEQAFRDRALKVANGGDVVVLRTSGTDGYNDYLFEMRSDELKPNSVETLRIREPAEANSDYVQWVVRSAELIWFAGGDQSTYLNAWEGTKLQSAMQEAFERGAVIGGTSAGLAILGEFIYDPDNVDSATAEIAAANPYDETMAISGRFLDAPILDSVITDTHFEQRDRLGRLMGFMAQLRQDGRTGRIAGVGVNEQTSIFIDSQGIGHVDAQDSSAGRAAYVLIEDDQTTATQVQPNQPLIYRNVLRTKLVPGDTFDFNTMTSPKTPVRLTIDGTANPFYSPANPYQP
ncbi:MAG: cyanophycinase [Sumerlaeia bacterium]